MSRLLLGLLLLAARVAGAQTITTPSGSYALLTLHSAGTVASTTCASTAVSTRAIDTAQGWPGLIVSYCATGGTATVKTQNSIDNGTSWVDVASSSKAIDSAGTACDGIGLLAPVGAYRTCITVIAGATVTTKARVGGRYP